MNLLDPLELYKTFIIHPIDSETMFFSFLAALIGTLLTGAQALLIYYQGEGFCFNDGCKVVDSLTTVDPLLFNIAGFVFFSLVALGLNRARKGSDLWKRFVSLILLAALAAEGILLAFQILVSQVFCSYCLIVLTLIILANVFLGPKQIFKGAVIFAAVLLVSFSLDYRSINTRLAPLETGTMARYQPADSTAPERPLFLFFSSSCTHCENVIEGLRDNRTCTINFNPVDRIDSFSFPGAVAANGYNHQVNLRYLKQFGIEKIPVLAERTESSLTLVQGEQEISRFLRQQCGSPAVSATGQETDILSGAQSSELSPLLPGDDGCSITTDCEEASIPSSSTSSY